MLFETRRYYNSFLPDGATQRDVPAGCIHRSRRKLCVTQAESGWRNGLVIGSNLGADHAHATLTAITQQNILSARTSEPP